MLIMKLSRWTLNLEKKVRSTMKTIFTIGYYCAHILFGPNLIIRFRFDVLPSTVISVIFLHISVGNETPTQSPPKLIMKMCLIAHWYDYVIQMLSQLLHRIYLLLLRMNKRRIVVLRISCWKWWLRRRLQLFFKSWFLFLYSWQQEFSILWGQRFCIEWTQK